MKHDVILLKEIESIIPEILKMDIPFKKTNLSSWWDNQKNNYYNNKILLRLIIRKLRDKYHKDYQEDELLYMQKLYVLYPTKYPGDLLDCPWEIVTVILNILSEEKRKFYLKLYLRYKWSKDDLEKYIVHDLYEKYVYVISKMESYDSLIIDDVIDFLIRMELFININS